MKFDVVDKMRYFIAAENNITSNTFNGYALDSIEEYRKDLRIEFSRFIEELDNNFKSPNILSEDGFLSLFYRANCWKKYLGYVEGQTNSFDSEFKDKITNANRLKFKEFFTLKEKYVGRVGSFLQNGVDSIYDGIKDYQELGKRSDLEKAKKLLEKYKGKQLYFACHMLPREREEIFSFLQKSKFIADDTLYADFKYAFVLSGEMKPIPQHPYLIKWIDTTKKNDQYNRKSLVYFIEKLITNGIVSVYDERVKKTEKEKNEIRNDTIKYFFADPDGNAIININDVQGDEEPLRAHEIKSFVKNLQLIIKAQNP
jgi:hypothetical protein